ncbi:hypothetical protein [Catellatospora chokoriensis]|uniref:Uncharacterized protein n=1 Tax=Catellatospora chokoriensis TaxID=310353 RepID=A0A8J3KE40_9ACTN|nr:hypothetical protein [Catellatospora chokoriensis]GIF94264.1 hypothetical protein Cch02nite_77080 [Catellatospora chokoriensis]
MSVSRKVVVPAATAAAAVVVTLVGVALLKTEDPQPAGVISPVASAAPTTPTPAATSPSATAARPTTPTTKPATVRPATPQRLGAVISTGMDCSPISEWVIYGVPVHLATAPGTTFGFALGERHNDGRIEEYIVINEYQGSDKAAGFHLLQGPLMLEGDLVQPAFGYYVGTPARITAEFDGKTITAHTARWSDNLDVTVYWFDPKASGHGVVSGLSAYDDQGKPMVSGHVEVVGH